MAEDLHATVSTANTIYFVCSGNIIRSAFAEIFARSLSLKNVGSYGTQYRNSKIHPRSVAELKRLGVDSGLIEKFSPTFIDDLPPFHRQDLHVVMTGRHRQDLTDRGVAPDRIILIKEILGRNGDVEDPYFHGNYETAYRTIKNAVEQIAAYNS